MDFPFRYLHAVLAGAVTIGAASAASGEPAPNFYAETKRFEIPGGDLFGFTSPAHGSSPGERGIALELFAPAGNDRGSYWSPRPKLRVSFTALENPTDTLSPWGLAGRMGEVPTLGDRAASRFDGYAGAVSYRFVERSPTNPFAATISVEPRTADLDASMGEGRRSYRSGVKLAVDAVLAPGRLYGAFNLNYGFATQRSFGLGERWADSSGTAVSGAVTYQFTDRLFAGVEGRWLTSFSGALLNEQMGWAMFAGPTMLLKVTDSAALNVMWTPQLTGSLGSNGAPDLESPERQQFQARFATSF